MPSAVFTPQQVTSILSSIKLAGLMVHRVILEEGGARLVVETAPSAMTATSVSEFDAVDFTHG